MNYKLMGKRLNEGQNRNSSKTNFQKEIYVKRVKNKQTEQTKTAFSLLCLLIKSPKKLPEST